MNFTAQLCYLVLALPLALFGSLNDIKSEQKVLKDVYNTLIAQPITYSDLEEDLLEYTLLLLNNGDQKNVDKVTEYLKPCEVSNFINYFEYLTEHLCEDATLDEAIKLLGDCVSDEHKRMIEIMITRIQANYKILSQYSIGLLEHVCREEMLEFSADNIEFARKTMSAVCETSYLQKILDEEKDYYITCIKSFRRMATAGDDITAFELQDLRAKTPDDLVTISLKSSNEAVKKYHDLFGFEAEKHLDYLDDMYFLDLAELFDYIWDQILNSTPTDKAQQNFKKYFEADQIGELELFIEKCKIVNDFPIGLLRELGSRVKKGDEKGIRIAKIDFAKSMTTEELKAKHFEYKNRPPYTLYTVIGLLFVGSLLNLALLWYQRKQATEKSTEEAPTETA